MGSVCLERRGPAEVYVDRFPERDAKRLVSTGGGGWPRWARDGSEIFYLSPDNRLMAVAVQINGDTLDVAAPRPLFTMSPRPQQDLMRIPMMSRRTVGASWSTRWSTTQGRQSSRWCSTGQRA